jgi:hypothetical protein
MVVMAEEL